jgi:hypothetical protein
VRPETHEAWWFSTLLGQADFDGLCSFRCCHVITASVPSSVAVDACIFLVLWNLAFGTVSLMLLVCSAFEVSGKFEPFVLILLCSEVYVL